MAKPIRPPSNRGDAEAVKRLIEQIDRERTREQAQRQLMSESPRVVCTKCPAVAKVHYWIAPEFNNGEAEIWMECHGEHVFGSVMPGIRQKTGEPLEFLFSQVRAHSIEYVNDMFERAERAMQKEAERAKLLQRFMRREPPT